MKDGTGSKMMKGQSVFLAGLLIFLTSSFIALSKKFVGEFWFRQVPKCMI